MNRLHGRRNQRKLYFFLPSTLFLLLPCPTGLGPRLYVMRHLRALLEDGIVLKRGLKSKSRDNLLLIFHFKRNAKEKSMPPLLTWKRVLLY
jgi:hypothetical protein